MIFKVAFKLIYLAFHARWFYEVFDSYILEEELVRCKHDLEQKYFPS